MQSVFFYRGSNNDTGVLAGARGPAAKTWLRHFLLPFLAAALFLPAAPSCAQELFEAKGFFPVTIAGATVRLEGMLVKKADAQGRLPIAILTNGGLKPTSNMTVKAVDYAKHARDMAQRGWLAIVVLRRGYGQSEGAKPVAMACQAAAFKSWASEAADDLQATMAFIAQRPDADPERVMVIAPESGGVAAVALSARSPRGLVATVSIAGAVLAESNCAMTDVLAQAYREFGTNNRVASLWIYAKDDKGIGRDLTERIHAAYLDGGGDVKFVEFHSWGNTEKDVFATRPLQWMLQVDGFLRARKLPTWTLANSIETTKKLGLTGWPRESAIMFIGETYMPWSSEKALVFSPSRKNTYASRSDSLEASKNRALESCKKEAQDCVLVMENLRWVGPNF